MAANGNPTQAVPNGRVGTIKNLLKGPHGPGSALYDEVAKFAADYHYHRADFLGLTAAEDIGASKVWQYTETGATPVDAAKITPTALLQSHVLLDTNTTDNANMNLETAPFFVAKSNPFIEARFQIDTALANDTFELSFGFVGVLPASAASVLGDIDTPTFGAGITDAAVIAMDGDETLKTAAFQTIGTSTAVGKTTLAPVTTPIGFPLLNTDITYRVELRSPSANSSVSRAYAFINGLLVAERAGPDAEKLMSGVFQLGVRSTIRVKVSLDYLVFGFEKAGAPFN